MYSTDDKDGLQSLDLGNPNPPNNWEKWSDLREYHPILGRTAGQGGRSYYQSRDIGDFLEYIGVSNDSMTELEEEVPEKAARRKEDVDSPSSDVLDCSTATTEESGNKFLQEADDTPRAGLPETLISQPITGLKNDQNGSSHRQLPESWRHLDSYSIPATPTRKPPLPPTPSPVAQSEIQRIADEDALLSQVLQGEEDRQMISPNPIVMPQTQTGVTRETLQHARLSQVSWGRRMPSIFGWLRRKKKSKRDAQSRSLSTDTTQPPTKLGSEGLDVSKVDEALQLHLAELRRPAQQDALLALAEEDRRRAEKEEADRLYAEELMRQEEERQKAAQQAILEAETRKKEEKQRRMAMVGALVGVRRVSGKDSSIVYVEDEELPTNVLYYLKDVKDAFMKGLPTLTVTLIEWIINDSLRVKYQKCKEEFKKSGRPTNELILFHGTASANIENIITNGFLIGSVNGHPSANGKSMGIGIYSSTDPSVPVGTYAQGARTVIAFRALPGIVSPNALRRSGGGIGREKYDSHSARDVYVIRRSCQTLPCFLVHY